MNADTMQNVQARFAELPEFLAGHMLLATTALAVGIAVSVPLGIFATRRPRLRAAALTVAGIIQTIPSMALLALMVSLLAGKTGFWPAFIAMSLYSVLPILRNTITGIDGVDRNLIEAARGIGMTSRQRLWMVELPLAMPVILAGIRTATVWVVGIATLSTPVGQPSLGNYIFQGLQLRNNVSILFGCVFAAALALGLDALIRMLETGMKRRSRPLMLTAGALLAAIVIGGLIPKILEAIDTTPRVAIASKPFTEQYILADVLERQVEGAGLNVARTDSLGSTVLFDGLVSGEFDCYVDYSGTIWTTIMKRRDNPGREAVLAEMTAYLADKHGVTCLGSLGFENAYCLAMTRQRAAELGITTIEDLARHAAVLEIGADAEFFGRPDWTNVREGYDLGHHRTRTMDAAFMYGAVRDGEVDVISAYTTDGRIDDYDLVVLEDPRAAFPPYDAVLLLSRDAAANDGIVKTLTPLLGRIDNATMRWANKLVDVDRSPIEAAGSELHARLQEVE